MIPPDISKCYSVKPDSLRVTHHGSPFPVAVNTGNLWKACKSFHLDLSKPANAHAHNKQISHATLPGLTSPWSSIVFSSMLPPAGDVLFYFLDFFFPPLLVYRERVLLISFRCTSAGFGGLAEAPGMAGGPPQREIWCVGTPTSWQTYQTVWKPHHGGHH